MTDLRKAAEMAFNALLLAAHTTRSTTVLAMGAEATDALRQALAQSANQSDCGHKEYKPFCQMCMATKQEPVRSFQQFGDTQPEQEPVAIIDDDGFAWGYGIEGGKLPSGTKVYTAPPKPDVTLTNKGKTEQDSFNRLIRIMGTFDLATGHADGWDDLLDSLEAELRDVLGHYREALKQAQPEQEPVAWHSHNPDYPIQDGDWVEVIFTSGQPDDAKKWTPLYTAPNVPIKQQNINTSEERVQKSEGCVHEPVAWRWLHNGKPDSNKCFDGTGPTEEAISNASSAEFPRSVQYLYTAPQNPDVTLISEGKTWQGLTDDELDLIYKQHHNEYGQGVTGQYERAIEAKLKEKNT